MNQPDRAGGNPQRLLDRAGALDGFVQAAAGVVPDHRLAPARVAVEHTQQRLARSQDHTVVALAGPTGSGKSSLFNAVARSDLSPVGVRRPTTGSPYACVWGATGALPLLDWLEVPVEHRFAQESGSLDDPALAGLVLLDLPDLDSVAASHRAEVDRLLELIDLVVWVTDPQKYADQLVHRTYLGAFGHHADITVVLLNQADRLDPADADRCLADLCELLAADGLGTVPVFATSVTHDPPGVFELRTELTKAVSARQAALHRLDADLTVAADALADAVGPPRESLDRGAARALTGALGGAAGVPAVVQATGAAYRHRAAQQVGWPPIRWWRRRQRDPLDRLRLERPDEVTSLPPAARAQQAAAASAVRRLGETTAAGLPEPWSAAVRRAAGSRLTALPDELDRAVAGTDLGVRTRWWWRLVGAAQWLATLATLAGLAWLGLRLVFGALGLSWLVDPHVGRVPMATLVLGGGLLASVLLAALTRPLVTIGASRARTRAARRLYDSIEAVASDQVVAPVQRVLDRYAYARNALAVARSR